MVLSCVQVQEMAWPNHFCMLPVRRAQFQMLYWQLSKVISLFLSLSCTKVESCGFPAENLIEHKLLVIHRLQAVLGCLYYFARGEEIFQCLVDDLGYATNFIKQCQIPKELFW